MIRSSRNPSSHPSLEPVSVPADLGKLIEISNRYGITFPGISAP